MASGPDEETGEIRPAPFELEPEPTPAPRGRKPAAWRASRWTGGAASVALFLLILGGLASSREGGAARGRGWRPHDPRPADARPVVDPRSTLTLDGPDRPVAVGAAEEMAHVHAIDAETERWSMLLPATSADHRVFGKPRGNGKRAGPDQRLGFACHRRAIPRALDEPLSIVGFEPVTTRPEATHHITAFGCDAGAESLPETFFGATCAVWAFAVNKENAGPGGKKAPCRVMIYAYDKGASGFRTPEGTAVKVGKGTGITHVVYQVHYLVPMEEAVPINPWADSSGIVFEIARGEAHRSRPKSLGVMAAMHTRMQLPTGEAKLPFSYTVGPFRDRLAPDFEAGAGEVTLVAAHLHGHHMLKRYETGLIRGGKQEPFGVIPAYRGYGPDQSFHPLPLGVDNAGASVTMGPDDVMYITCTFDTSDAGGDWVDYGVAHGAEMCGQILYYHPFASKAEAGGDGGAGRLVRPEPTSGEDRDNDLYNVFFNQTDILTEGVERDMVEGAAHALAGASQFIVN